MIENTYLNSVRVQRDKCNGCMACIKRCSVGAIRVRKGKALILANRCIDCGECVRRCPEHAMIAVADTLQQLGDYEYNIALATTSLYAQFPSNIKREDIWHGIQTLGFDEIFDVSAANDYISKEIEDYLNSHKDGRKPHISSGCPAVLRLIQVKYPELLAQVIPILAPGEAAAIYTRREVCKRLKLPSEKIGIWFLTPCPAKCSNIHKSVNVKQTAFNGSISISSIYGKLFQAVNESVGKNKKPKGFTTGSSYGIGWATFGGEVASLGIENALVVHGITQINEILEQISMNTLPEVEFVECYMCGRGCVGGPFAAVNRFVAEKNIRMRIRCRRAMELPDRITARAAAMTCKNFPTSEQYIKKLEPKPAMQLDDDISVAMEKLTQLDKLMKQLPGLDCGACGAPSCNCLAEDIIQGKAQLTDCTFILRSQAKKDPYKWYNDI